jgi:CheY-like chemotaxis protein
VNLNTPEILLVEDNPQHVELTLRALKKNRRANNVVVAKDGVEALDLLFGTKSFSDRKAGHDLKLVLLDLKLPKVDGLEVLRRIKSDERTKAIPVVVLTTSSEEEDVVESYRLGVNSYIVKPCNFDKFVQSVSALGLYWMLLNKAPE